MKLNTWHWLGIALLVVALILTLRNRISPTERPVVPATAPVN